MNVATQDEEVITIGIYEAKTRLSELVDRVLNGARVEITRYGCPQVALVDVSESAQKKRRNLNGFMKEQLKDWKVPEDFDTMMQDEIIAMFEGDYSPSLSEEALS